MKVKSGSIVIIVLILMTALVALTHSALRTSSYLILLARDRELYEKKYQTDVKTP